MTRRLSFTVAREPIVLDIGGEDFHAPAVIPPVVLGKLLEQQKAISGIDIATVGVEQVLEAIAEVFGLILVPESGQRFRERLFSRDNPFDLMNEVIPTMTGLIEEYTDRPTQPSPPSSNGQASDGTSSTAGAPAEQSTPLVSPPTGSST